MRSYRPILVSAVALAALALSAGPASAETLVRLYTSAKGSLTAGDITYGRGSATVTLNGSAQPLGSCAVALAGDPLSNSVSFATIGLTSLKFSKTTGTCPVSGTSAIKQVRVFGAENVVTHAVIPVVGLYPSTVKGEPTIKLKESGITCIYATEENRLIASRGGTSGPWGFIEEFLVLSPRHRNSPTCASGAKLTLSLSLYDYEQGETANYSPAQEIAVELK